METGGRLSGLQRSWLSEGLCLFLIRMYSINREKAILNGTNAGR